MAKLVITQALKKQSITKSFHKLFSSKATGGGGGKLIEVDLDSSNDEIEVMGLKRLEDAIHSIIVRRLAPDWLPFRPGSSYWVPPKHHRSDNILQLVGKLTDPLSDDESLSLSSDRGWPSSSFFINGSLTEHQLPVEVEVEVQVHSRSSPDKTLSEDEE